MEDLITIQESYTLPSNGLIYDKKFNPTITLRSMTTEEEMRRLSRSESEYKTMASIIDSCIVEKLPISVYDMCIGDYQFLLHKIRVVTYGSNYKLLIQCPHCGELSNSSVDLDTLEVLSLTEETLEDLHREITLPVSKRKITLSFQTPRMLDNVKERAKEQKKKTKLTNVNFEILFTAMSLIGKVDGLEMDDIRLEQLVRKLPLKDLYYIIQEGDKLNRKVGLDTSVVVTCENCGLEVQDQFRIQPNFFGPEVLG